MIALHTLTGKQLVQAYHNSGYQGFAIPTSTFLGFTKTGGAMYSVVLADAADPSDNSQGILYVKWNEDTLQITADF